MKNDYIFSAANILSVVILMFFVIFKIKASRKYGNLNKNDILLRSGFDEVSSILFVLVGFILIWKIDSTSFGFGSGVYVSRLLMSNLLIYMSIGAIALYYTVNRNIVTTKGVARIDLLNNIEDIILWNQIVSYRWEENCLLIDYKDQNRVDIYVWKGVSQKDKNRINSIFRSFIIQNCR